MTDKAEATVILLGWVLAVVGTGVWISVRFHRSTLNGDDARYGMLLVILLGWAWPAGLVVGGVFYLLLLAHKGIGLLVTPKDEVLVEAEREVERICQNMS